MPVFARYALLGCLAPFFVACGSSGSQTVVSSTSSSDEVKYLLPTDQASTDTIIGKFPGAAASQDSAASLNTTRNQIVENATRYLSTGALVVTSSDTNPAAVSCMDGMGATEANCVFDADALRDEVMLHLGQTDTTDDVYDAGLQDFMADREPVMDYRGIKMYQLRSTGTDTKQSAENSYHYVGYGGILVHSMFFVGVYKFFDEDDDLVGQRLENASLGQIYDHNGSNGTTIDNPGMDLTGNGAMVGIEALHGTQDNHLVQGDVRIDYNSTDAEVDIEITNIQRLVGDDAAWYSSLDGLDALDWAGLTVEESKFDDTSDGDSDNMLRGSFYGTADSPEVGGVFSHTGELDIDNDNSDDGTYSIVGSFGSTRQ